MKAVAGMLSINIRVKGLSFQRSSPGWKIHLNITCSPYKQDTDAIEEIQLITWIIIDDNTQVHMGGGEQ